MSDNLWSHSDDERRGNVRKTTAYYSEDGLCKPGTAYLYRGQYYAGNGEPLAPTGETQTVLGWQIDGEFPVYTLGGDHPDACVTVVPVETAKE